MPAGSAGSKRSNDALYVAAPTQAADLHALFSKLSGREKEQIRSFLELPLVDRARILKFLGTAAKHTQSIASTTTIRAQVTSTNQRPAADAATRFNGRVDTTHVLRGLSVHQQGAQVHIGYTDTVSEFTVKETRTVPDASTLVDGPSERNMVAHTLAFEGPNGKHYTATLSLHFVRDLAGRAKLQGHFVGDVK